jgi:hypothetical protein
MQKCFLLMVCFFLAIAVGCNEGPKGDPEFKKAKIDAKSEQPVQGEKEQEAPPM